jgi:hypothetical protein
VASCLYCLSEVALPRHGLKPRPNTNLEAGGATRLYPVTPALKRCATQNRLLSHWLAHFSLRFFGSPREQSPAEAGSNGIVQLYRHDRRDSPISADKTKSGTAGIERLSDDDAADDGGMNLVWDILRQQAGASGVAPAPVKCYAQQNDIEPIDQKRNPITDEFGKQRRRKWDETHGTEERDMNPGEIPVRAGEVIELRLLADPEDAESHHAHQKNQEPR